MDNHKFEYMSIFVYENKRHQRRLRREQRETTRRGKQMLVPWSRRISSATLPSPKAVIFSGEVSLANVFACLTENTWEGEAPTRDGL